MTNLSSKSGPSPDMLAILDCFEGKLAEAMCQLRPTDPRWQRFGELAKASLTATLDEFPGMEADAIGAALVRPEYSPIDDALREARAMFNVALQQAGMSSALVELLLEWIEFSVQARGLQFRIADMRFKLEASVVAE